MVKFDGFEIEPGPFQMNLEKLIRVVGIAEDISSHKAAEASLRNYEQMVSTTPDLMAFVDTNYRYQAVNKRYAEVFEKPQRIGHWPCWWPTS